MNHLAQSPQSKYHKYYQESLEDGPFKGWSYASTCTEKTTDDRGRDKYSVTIFNKQGKTETFNYSSGINHRISAMGKNGPFLEKRFRVLLPPHKVKHTTRNNLLIFQARTVYVPDLKNIIWCLYMDYRTVLDAGPENLCDYLALDLGYDELKPSKLQRLALDFQDNATKFQGLLSGINDDQIGEYFQDY